MSGKTELKRTYRFSDGVLMQLADTVIRNATRDSAELDPLGVTTARLNALGALKETFRDMEDDVEWKGLVSERKEQKDAAMGVCNIGSNNIRRMVANVYGERTAKYKRFGFASINGRREVERIKAYFRVWRRAGEHAADLASEGLTAEVLDAFHMACEDFDAAYDAMEDITIERDIASEARVELGNRIYAEVAKICNTGKTYWMSRSHARYNDYVITPSGATSGAATEGV